MLGVLRACELRRSRCWECYGKVMSCGVGVIVLGRLV